jgi:hypothetical protein
VSLLLLRERERERERERDTLSVLVSCEVSFVSANNHDMLLFMNGGSGMFVRWVSYDKPRLGVQSTVLVISADKAIVSQSFSLYSL